MLLYYKDVQNVEPNRSLRHVARFHYGKCFTYFSANNGHIIKLLETGFGRSQAKLNFCLFLRHERIAERLQSGKDHIIISGQVNLTEQHQLPHRDVKFKMD